MGCDRDRMGLFWREQRERAHCGAENSRMGSEHGVVPRNFSGGSRRGKHTVVPRIALVTSHGERARTGAERLFWRGQGERAHGGS